MHVAGKLAALALISLVILISGCSPRPAGESWNFLVYLNADNNLEPYGIQDLNEMEKVGSSANLKILVLFDRSPRNYDISNGDWSGARLYLVTRDHDSQKIHSKLLVKYGELDMSDPATLRDFIICCQKRYPADRTILTLWNHGGGVWPRAVAAGATTPTDNLLRGISWDDSSDTQGPWNCLTTDKVAWALSEARKVTRRRIDVINLDACSMQMLEVAYEWRDEADYLVGSEEVVPGPGNDYTRILSYLRDAPRPLGAREAAAALVESYYAYYSNTYDSTTYSALSLGADFKTLADAFKDFATALRNTPDLAGITAAWQGTTYFYDHENRDLYSFASEIETRVTDPQVKNAAASLKQALNQAVILHAETGWYRDKAFGLSVLLPSAQEWSYYSEPNQYVTLNLSQDTDWDEFIVRFVNYTGP